MPLTVNPFVSESQRRWMYSQHPEMAKRWEAHTPKGRLPPKLRKRKSKGKRRVANLATNATKLTANLRTLKRRHPFPTGRIDPTRSITLRLAFAAELKRRFARLKLDLWNLVYEQDEFGIDLVRNANATNVALETNAQGWAFQTSHQKLASFKRWLESQVDMRIGKGEDALIQRYIEAGFKKGLLRSWQEQGKPVPQDRSFYLGGKESFLRQMEGHPVTVEQVKALAARTFNEVDGISAQMRTNLSRIVLDGFTQGLSKRQIADRLIDEVGLSARKAIAIASDSIVRASAEGQLRALEALGVTHVGVMVEWQTAGDERVCSRCRPLEGVRFTIEQAKGMLPRHLGCRCSWSDVDARTPMPARAKKAVQRSQKAGKDDEYPWGPASPIKYEPRKRIKYQRGLRTNVFCPTGVDPTCSPADARGQSKEAYQVSETLAGFAGAGESTSDYLGPAREARRNAAAAAKAAKSGDHALASEYHKDAATHHEDAAEAHREYAGRDVRHEEAAQLHDAAATEHRRLAKMTHNASDTPVSVNDATQLAVMFAEAQRRVGNDAAKLRQEFDGTDAAFEQALRTLSESWLVNR